MPLHIPKLAIPELATQYEPRFITPADAAAVTAFDAEMFPEPHLEDPTAYWADQAANHSQNTEIIAVEGKIAAYMHVVLKDSQKQPGRQYAELQALGVAPEYRRQGVGTFLGARAMQRALDAYDVMAFRLFAESGGSTARAAESIGFTVSSNVIWGKDADGRVRGGYYFDLLVPQK
jgi:GNAT superfamily N-acetyltransferase